MYRKSLHGNDEVCFFLQTCAIFCFLYAPHSKLIIIFSVTYWNKCNIFCCVLVYEKLKKNQFSRLINDQNTKKVVLIVWFNGGAIL